MHISNLNGNILDETFKGLLILTYFVLRSINLVRKWLLKLRETISQLILNNQFAFQNIFLFQLTFGKLWNFQWNKIKYVFERIRSFIKSVVILQTENVSLFCNTLRAVS